MTDDSEIVRLSDRVMAGRHPLTDQARREEIRGEEGGGGRRGKPGSFVFQSRGDRGGGDGRGKENKSRSARVTAVLLLEAPRLVDDVFEGGSKTENVPH